LDEERAAQAGVLFQVIATILEARAHPEIAVALTTYSVSRKKSILELFMTLASLIEEKIAFRFTSYRVERH
jgi:hypothetical protein